MRLILKNLWKRRKQNVWLSVELVLVSIVCWFVIDPLFVIAYHAFGGSDGYDADRLVILTTHSKGKNTIVIEQPYIGEHQSWGISLIPLFKHK